MNDDSKTYKGQSSLARSLVSNWLGLGLAVVIGFFLSPFVVHSLNKEVYGYWAIVISITSQLMMLDLGIRNAVVKYISELRATHQDEIHLSELLSSSALLLFILAVVGFLCLLTLGYKLELFFEISPEFLQLTKLVFFIMTLEASIELAFGVFDASIAANERYDIINATNSLRLFLQAVLLVVVLSMGGGILSLALVTFSTRVLQRLLAAYFAFKIQPGIQIRPNLARKQLVVKIAKYGSWAAVISVGSRIIYHIDSLVVGAFLGPIAVTFYAVPVIIIEMFRNLSQSSSTILAPRFSALSSLERVKETETILFHWTSFATLLAFAIGVPLIICGNDFLMLWMGKEFSRSTAVLVILVIPFFFVLPALGVGQLLLGNSNHALYGKLILAEAICNLSLSLILVKSHGLIGVACGTLFPAILFRGFLLPYLAAKSFYFSFYRYLKQSYERTLPLAALYCCILISLRAGIGHSSWLEFIVVNTLGAFSFAFASYCFYFDEDERAYLLRRFSLKH